MAENLTMKHKIQKTYEKDVYNNEVRVYKCKRSGCDFCSSSKAQAMTGECNLD